MADWISEVAPDALGHVLGRVRPHFASHPKRRRRFEARLEAGFERIFRLLHRLYGWRYDFGWRLEGVIDVAARAAARRPAAADDERVDWLHDPATVWAMAYTDRFVGTLAGYERAIPHLRSLGVTHLHMMPPYACPVRANDGGYAVSDYRRVRPELGTIDDLRRTLRRLADEGIAVALDFVANHTADDHAWAESAKAGDDRYQRFYLMFDDRSGPDRYVPHLRPIFPERGGDAFTWRPDVAGPAGGKWVWTTFHTYQWDLDYSNPEVLTAMAGELLHLVDLGASVIRMDATPFLWKQPGTSCENLDEAHVVLQVFNALVQLVAPGVELLSEAIVHPSEVAQFVRPDECVLGYNPLVMALTWEALATRDTTMLADALRNRSRLPPGCQWLTYLRCHDDIGWGFADEDALRLGIDPRRHRDLLNAFYTGETPDSFAAGARFQENPVSGDARISGTLASLAGLERAMAADDPHAVDLAVRRILAMHVVSLTSVGVPLLYLGDEIGLLNDHSYLEDPALAADNRWMHRPWFDWDLLAAADEGVGPVAPLLAGVRALIAFRKGRPSLAAGPIRLLPTHHREVLAYFRGEDVLVVVNLSERPLTELVAAPGPWVMATGEPFDPTEPFFLPGYGYRLAVRAGA